MRFLTVKFLVQEIVPIILILTVMAVLTYFPWHGSQQKIEADRQQINTICQLSSILREWVASEANTRSQLAKQSNKPASTILEHAADVNEKVRRKLNHIPNTKC